MRSHRILIVQIAIILLCIAAVGLLTVNFPFPSPLIKPILPPKLRWPTAQVEQWVEAGNFGSGFLEFFARDPERKIPPGDNLVSPADGMVQNVAYRDGVTYLVIGLSFWDVHVVRTPIAGIVEDVDQEGFYFGRNDSKAELQESFFLKGKAAPVQQIVSIDTDGSFMKVRLISSYWASRIKVWVHDGERLERGQRIGRMLLGSTVVAEFQGNRKLEVKPGQRVVGGETVIFEGAPKK